MWPASVLAEIADRDERWWNALYMLRPSPPGGVIFHLAWWDNPANRYDPDALGLPDTPVTVARFLFFDTAFKRGEDNDLTACSVVEVLADYRLRWRDLWEEKVEFPDLIDRMVETGAQWNRDGKLYEMVIEDKGSGTSALQTLRKAGPLWLRNKLAAFLPTQSKEQRARQAAVWCKKGGVLLPHPRASVPWLAAFERQIADFPRAVHDDSVDTLSMGVIYLENYLARWERGLSLIGTAY
jgi:predicted phage terminase large subunit-like protein